MNHTDQVLQALRVEIAGQAGVDVYDVSLPLLVKYLPLFADRGLHHVPVLSADASLSVDFATGAVTNGNIFVATDSLGEGEDLGFSARFACRLWSYTV